MAEAAPAPTQSAERAESEHALFGRIMKGAAGADWGFVVVRTAYAADAAADADQWSRALARLRRLAAGAAAPDRKEDNGGAAAALATPVMACPATLQGARYADVRRAFAAWRARYLRETAGEDDDDDDDADDDDDDDGWPAAVRHDCCLVVDAEALASLLLDGDGDGDDDDDAWAVVVDARDPRTVPYGGGGGPYAGWLRAAAPALAALAADLDALSLGEEIVPPRAYLGQIPLYDGGFPRARLVDPPDGGVEGRYRFPAGGTARGAGRARAVLEGVLRDVGEGVYE